MSIESLSHSRNPLGRSFSPGMTSGEINRPKQDAATVLVVDDTPTNRFVLKSALKQGGYQVLEAQSGEQCLELCRTNPPGLILLDYVMPGIDGIETCRELRKKFPSERLPVLMVTSTAESEKLVEALSAGATDYVTKPVDRAVLLARVAAHFERRESHDQLQRALEIQRALGEMVPQAIVVERAGGEVLYSNSKVPEPVRGQGSSTIFNALYDGIAAQEYQRRKSRLAHEPLSEIDFEVRRDSGLVRALEVSSRALVLQGGEILRLWMWRDITTTRELERKVNERVRLDMVSLFVGGVAHNFNNMLMSVAGAAEILNRSLPPDPKSQRLMKIIIDGVQAAAKFCRKMNVFSRPDIEERSGSGESVAEVIHAVILPLEVEFLGKVEFELVIEEGLPETSMPLQHLSEAMASVLRNAAESIVEQGKVIVNVVGDSASNSLTVTIADTGVGMSAEVLSRIFEPFFSTKNLDQRNSVSLRGNGLGLWNTYNLLKLAGGDISIESAAGEGTVCTIQLPVRTGALSSVTVSSKC